MKMAALFKFVSILFLINISHAKSPDFPVKKYKSFLQTVGMKKNDNEINWSGGHWNPVTKTLYFCRNKWGIRSFKFNDDKTGKGFSLDKDLEFTPRKKHDFESITQSNLNSEVVWVINENAKSLEEYDLSEKKPKLLSDWDLKKITNKDESFEGLVFVPNRFLAKQNFKDADGNLYPKAKSGRSGIFLISDQNTGIVYGLDLSKNGKVDVIGSYKLPLKSTRALDLDYETGFLFALDGEKFAVFNLNSEENNEKDSDRSFKVKKLFKGPGPSAAEGLAVVSSTDSKMISFMITDDDNEKNIAIRWYEVERDLIFK